MGLAEWIRSKLCSPCFLCLKAMDWFGWNGLWAER